MATIKLVRPSSDSEKHTRTTVDTIELTAKLVASWKLPPFQRELKINNKVLMVAAKIKEDDGVIPGMITLGVLDKEVYIVDGQHRLHAFLMADVTLGYADIRTVFFDNIAEMATEFELLNSQLVTLRPDDKLRAYEHSNEPLRRIRKKCPFIGYDSVRRDSKNSPVLSMSTFIRAWVGSRSDTPTMGETAKVAVQSMDDRDTDNAILFAGLCFTAWQRDREYWRLWGSLNLSLCAWLYRRLVLAEGINPYARSIRMTNDQFKKSLMALSADSTYVDWLVGRNAGDRDRAPGYSRVKSIFAARFHEETGQKALMPGPAWATHSGR